MRRGILGVEDDKICISCHGKRLDCCSRQRGRSSINMKAEARRVEQGFRDLVEKLGNFQVLPLVYRIDETLESDLRFDEDNKI